MCTNHGRAQRARILQTRANRAPTTDARSARDFHGRAPTATPNRERVLIA